jgi:hypothetical protein
MEVSMSDDQQMASYLEAMPFAASLGIELRSASAEEVRGTLQWAEDRPNNADSGRAPE